MIQTAPTPPLCQVCDYHLDARGRCASCARVLPKDLEQLKWRKVFWIECKRHGAVEPEDGQRMVKVGHSWNYSCPRCTAEKRYGTAHEALTLRDIIVRRSEDIEEERAHLLKAWGAPAPAEASK